MDFPIPLLIVQHISGGFVHSLARWLDDAAPVRVKVAVNGEKIQPGTAYLAPDGYHMRVLGRGQIALEVDEKVDGHCPSASVLFRSVAQTYGKSSLGLLLTGMGEDGARGLGAIQQAGGRTLAQDESTSIVFGMARAAVNLNTVDEVLPLNKIGPRLAGLVRIGSGPLALKEK